MIWEFLMAERDESKYEANHTPGDPVYQRIGLLLVAISGIGMGLLMYLVVSLLLLLVGYGAP